MIKKIICAAMAVILLSFSAFAGERPSLFVGDEVWGNDSLLPFIETEGKKLLPISVFAEFDIKVTHSEKANSLLLEQGESYLSYSLSLGKVMDESGEISNCTVYRYGGELYIDPTTVCEKFGLLFSTVFAPDGYLAARLSDGSETVEFYELLKLHTENAAKPLPFLYNPTGKTVGGSFMYPTLVMPAVANVNILILQLGKHSATFAISPDKLKNYASVIPSIYAAGHTVAYYFDKTEFYNPQGFAEKMNSANDWLFAFIGKTSNIYVSSEPANKTPNIAGYCEKSCNIHLVADDLGNDRIINMTLTESSGIGVHNFTLASDYTSRSLYEPFFKKFDSYEHLRSMALTEPSPTN